MAFKKLALTNASGYQLRLAYDATRYTDLATSDLGFLTITPSAGRMDVTGVGVFSAAVEIGAGGVAAAGNLGWNENGVRSWQMGYAASSGNLSLGSGDGNGSLLINTNKFTVALSSGNTTLAGTLTTGAPTGGAGAWKLGIANAVSPTAPNRTLTVEIGGTTYYIHAKTTNN